MTNQVKSVNTPRLQRVQHPAGVIRNVLWRCKMRIFAKTGQINRCHIKRITKSGDLLMPLTASAQKPVNKNDCCHLRPP